MNNELRPNREEKRQWCMLDAAEAEGETPFPVRGDREWRPLTGYEHEAVRATLAHYSRATGSLEDLGCRHDVARKLGVEHFDVRLGRNGWEITRKARPRFS